MNLNEKAAYLKGLVEGTDLSFGEKEKKIVDILLDLVFDISAKVTEIDEDLSDLYDGFDEICDEIDAINEDIEDIYDDDDDECDCGCHHHHGFDEEEELYQVECGKCNEVICIDEDTLLGGGIECPNCGEPLEFEIGCDCDECAEEDDE